MQLTSHLQLVHKLKMCVWSYFSSAPYVLPPDDNPIAVNKYIIISYHICFRGMLFKYVKGQVYLFIKKGIL